MIQLQRDRTAGAIPKTFRGPGRIEKLLLLLKGKRAGKPDFDAKVWKAAKNQLKKESGGKCAYCEASTAVVAHGDVEHFRPKDLYWWLAYCYDNYLYSCQICNEQYKSNHFPVRGARLAEPPLPGETLADSDLWAVVARFTPDPLNNAEGLSWVDHQQALAAEEADLPDPYAIDPEPLFRWTSDPVQKEVEIAPRDASAQSQAAFAAVRDYYGLNRQELKRVRWPIYRDLAIFRAALEGDRVDQALRRDVADTVRAMMAPDAQFAGMVRYFVVAEWNLSLD